MSAILKELFVLNPETQMVDINKPWISTVKEFKIILKRDKSKQKSRAEKDFTFIYHLVDYRSSFSDYSEQDRLSASLQNAGFETTFDYTSDPELEQAVEVYRIMKDTAGLLMLFELKQGLHASQRVVRKIRKDLEARLDKMDTDEFEEEDGKKDQILIISDRLDRIMDIAKRLPTTLKSIEELEQSIKRELADIPELKGGAEKGAREDGLNNYVGNPMSLV